MSNLSPNIDSTNVATVEASPLAGMDGSGETVLATASSQEVEIKPSLNPLDATHHDSDNRVTEVTPAEHPAVVYFPIEAQHKATTVENSSADTVNVSANIEELPTPCFLCDDKLAWCKKPRRKIDVIKDPAPFPKIPQPEDGAQLLEAVVDEVAFSDPLPPNMWQVNQSPELRRALVGSTNILRGVIVTPNGPMPSGRELYIFDGPLPAANMNEARFRSDTMETSSASSFVNNGWTEASVDFSSPWVSASTSVQLLNMHSGVNERRTVYASSFLEITRGFIDFDVREMRAHISSDFIGAIDWALQGNSQNVIRHNLMTAFNYYGHIFNTRLVLGATYVCTSSAIAWNEAHETSIRQELSAAVQAGVMGWGGGIGGSVGTHTQTTTLASNQTITMTLFVRGGQSSLLFDRDAWLHSTEHFQNWVVTRADNPVPTIELLDDHRRNRVLDAMAPIIGRWIHVNSSGAWLEPDMRLYPGWFWLGQSAKTQDSGSRILIVQARDPSALGWLWALDGLVTQNGWAVTSLRPMQDGTRYNALSILIQPGHPVFTENVMAIRPVRRDLLIPGEKGEQIMSSGTVVLYAVNELEPTNQPNWDQYEPNGLVVLVLAGSHSTPNGIESICHCNTELKLN
ncbi:uncharacterized protein FIBRA_02864 [Fibroporia radiculosa]|uniref:MACPF-like domain-containing protein n=1 Tax=Fibroporia radiculosa TaxID=599839 RepID=J4HVM2_9APHY|nr:uncharacterized protein FIBRA_02864 [Fibroporia radiculosa]CCM00822.1 predicted protein [Fibroporia radiculosa]